VKVGKGRKKHTIKVDGNLNRLTEDQKGKMVKLGILAGRVLLLGNCEIGATVRQQGSAGAGGTSGSN